MSDQSCAQKCCDRPKFPLVTQIVSMVLGLIAFILSGVAASGCKFIEIEIPGVTLDNGFGLSKYYGCPTNACIQLKCYEYTALDGDITDDPNLKAAKAMGILAAIVGSLTWVACMLMLFIKLPACIFKTIGGLYVFCFVAQMLTLLVLNHENCNADPSEVLVDDYFDIAVPEISCKLSQDAIISIVAGIFYLGLAITILVCPAPKSAVVQGVNCGGCGDDCGCCGDGVETISQTKDVPSIVASSAQSPANGPSTTVSGGQAMGSTTTETFNPETGVTTIVEERINPDGTTTTTTTTKSGPSA